MKETKAALCLARLRELFPETFTTPPRPLKIGIDKDLIPMIARLGYPFSKRGIQLALKLYVLTPGYQAALRTGAGRFGLDGAAAGDVSEAENVAARAKGRVLKASPYPPPPKPAKPQRKKPAAGASAKTATAKPRLSLGKSSATPVVVVKKRRSIVKP